MRDNNRLAFNAGHAASERDGNTDRDRAFPAYRDGVAANNFDPSISASVCFVAGWLGNPYPSHDDRVTS